MTVVSDANVEKRISSLEREVEDLKTRMQASDNGLPWWERIAGRFAQDPLYEEAMQQGSEYRQNEGAVEPPGDTGQAPS